jgi:tetratricopeptide (TPR) repeat protein
LLQAQPGLAARRPELLARHFGGAGETGRAVRCWIDAGQRSLRDLACADALHQFEAGLAMVAELDAGAARERLECALWQGVGVCAHLAEGFGSARADAAFDRAMELASRVGERRATFQALWGLWQGASSRPGTSEATTLARRLLALSEGGEAALQQQAHYALGNGLLYRGELAGAAKHLERSIALEGAGAATLDGHGRVTAVTSRSYLAWTRWLQGRGAEALPWLKASLRGAREHGAPDTLAMALAFAAVLRGWRGEYATSHALATEGHALARQHGLAVPMLANGMAAAWAEVHLGEAEGLVRLERMVATVRVAMDGITASFLVPQAEAHLRLDDAGAAVALCEEALQLMDTKGDRYYAAAAARVRGEALARLGQPEAAEAALADAIARARAQGASALALQAGVALARLRQQGPSATRAMLAPLRAAVDEAPGSPWLAPADALLAEAG